MLVEDANRSSEWVLTSSALVEGATIEGCDYWQAVHWWKMRQQKGVVIGKQCTGGRCDTRKAWLLASNALVEDAILEGHGHWQAVCWQKKMQHWKGVVIGKRCTGRGCNNSGVWLLASSALAEDVAMTELPVGRGMMITMGIDAPVEPWEFVWSVSSIVIIKGNANVIVTVVKVVKAVKVQQ
ncbi:hypothetical protein BD769DRAFT_1391667 [Suillus cothurnatus]|nr:hypothetical protein BD769DRAFT_1391667 [Suillus cothurnatus]